MPRLSYTGGPIPPSSNDLDLASLRWRQLSDVQVAVASAATLRDGLLVLTDGLAEMADGPVVVFEQEAAAWSLAASGGRVEPGVLPTPEDLQHVSRLAESIAAVTLSHGRTWHAVRLAPGARRASRRTFWLLLPNSWPRPAPTLADVRRSLLLALQAVDLREQHQQSRRRIRTAFRFADRLTRVATGQLAAYVVHTLAREVGARKAAISLYDERESRLAIVATHGYPLALVQDLRLQPGTGVMGRVFASGRPLLTIGKEDFPEGAPRSRRYRSGSLLALPVAAEGETLGVLTLTDREDGRPFSRADLVLARSLMPPAALALGRARMAAQAQQLAVAATVDPLTGLFNRRYLLTQLEAEIERARRQGGGLGLLMLDVDNFKRLNDTVGHPAGDAVLRRVAQTLRRAVRSFDICARYGGDEFAILLPGSEADNAVHTAERICQRVAGLQTELTGLGDLPLTVSAGVAILREGGSAEELIARADRALYEAKRAGRGCVKVEH
jgi:diguanylate cyclase (GGDEF)-like protein